MKLFGSKERKAAIRALPPDDARNYAKHARTLQEAADVMLHRSARYGATWRQYGALANLLQGATAVNRLMATWWFQDDERPAFHKDVLDDAYDAINYLAFFIALATEGEVQGSVPDWTTRKTGAEQQALEAVLSWTEADAYAADDRVRLARIRLMRELDRR